MVLPAMSDNEISGETSTEVERPNNDVAGSARVELACSHLEGAGDELHRLSQEIQSDGGTVSFEEIEAAKVEAEVGSEILEAMGVIE